VKFALPSDTYGTLYYDDDTAVTSSMRFYADDVYVRAISDVSFLADASASGSTTITYRAYDGDGTYLYTGTVYIVIID